jgi:hypothetical protein
MNAKEILNFLKLLHHTGCLSGYWKARVADMIQRMGGKV